MDEFWEKIYRLDKSDRVALKRIAGKRLCEASGQALAVFYRILPAAYKFNEEKLFASACLECLWKKEDMGRVLPLAQCMREVKSSDSYDRRMIALLDTNWQEDGFMLIKLYRIVKQIKASPKNIKPDFKELYNDLSLWSSDGRWVQRKWAKIYFVIEGEENGAD